MAIDDDFQLHEGAFANIRLASNVGAVNRVVDLEQGDTTAPELPEGTVLRDDQTDQPGRLRPRGLRRSSPRSATTSATSSPGSTTRSRAAATTSTAPCSHSGVALSETGRLLAQVNRDGEALRTIVGEGSEVVAALGVEPGRPRRGRRADGDRARDHRAAPGRAGRVRAAPRPGAGRRARALLDRHGRGDPNLRELVGGLGPLVDELGPLAELIPAATRPPGRSSTRRRSS